jgi:CBS domain-containing protein
MKARDVMTKCPTCATPDARLEAIARMMIQCDCGAIPIVSEESGLPLGMVTDRDIVVRTIADGLDPLVLTARDCMTTPAVSVSEEEDLGDVVDLLERRQIRRAIVVDQNGALSGIISLADIAPHASKRKGGELLREVSVPLSQMFIGHSH